jgi:plasmid replication initiation protein
MNEKNSLIKMSNALIENVVIDPSLVRQKLVLLIMSKIRCADEDFKTYELPVADLIAGLGLAPESAYTRIENEVVNLMKRIFLIKRLNAEGKLVRTRFAWFSFFETVEGAGTVKLRFDPAMKPYLIQLKARFTTAPLACALALRSTYSLRLYEYLKMEAAFKHEVYFDLEAFKTLFEIDKAASFVAYGHIKADLLLPALAEISAKTDIHIIGKPKETKKGRKVIGFKISFKAQPSPAEQAKEEIRAKTLESLESSATSLSFLDPDALQFPEEKVLLDNIQ